MFKRIINFLDWLTQEIPPPKPVESASIKLIQPSLTPAEQEILKQAEQTLRQLEAQSIQASPVIGPAPVALLEVPEIPVSLASIKPIATTQPLTIQEIPIMNESLSTNSIAIAAEPLTLKEIPATEEVSEVPEVLETPITEEVSEVLEVLSITGEISEVPEVLEVLETPVTEAAPLEAETEILEMVESLESLTTKTETTPAGWTAIEVGAEQPPTVIQPEAVEIQSEAVEIPEVPELPQPTVRASSQKASRGQLVEQHLNQAWEDGFRTYDQLMNYIELATGKACSKKVISAWKKSRQANTEVTAA